MASMFVATGGGDKDQQHHPHPSPRHNKKVSPRSSFKKTWSSNPPPPPSPPSPCGHGDHHQAGGALPKCVCAPATHAGSFKCRLHRVNSHGHSAPPPPPASAPETSTRTVEAQ